jgi:hypothetical protein
LVSDFAEHYLELVKVGYKELPDISILDTWLRHLHLDIRPALQRAWEQIAAHYGFALGDKIRVEHPKQSAVEVYAVRIRAIGLRTSFVSSALASRKMENQPNPQ